MIYDYVPPFKIKNHSFMKMYLPSFLFRFQPLASITCDSEAKIASNKTHI